MSWLPVEGVYRNTRKLKERRGKTQRKKNKSNKENSGKHENKISFKGNEIKNNKINSCYKTDLKLLTETHRGREPIKKFIVLAVTPRGRDQIKDTNLQAIYLPTYLNKPPPIYLLTYLYKPPLFCLPCYSNEPPIYLLNHLSKLIPTDLTTYPKVTQDMSNNIEIAELLSKSVDAGTKQTRYGMREVLINLDKVMIKQTKMTCINKLMVKVTKLSFPNKYKIPLRDNG